MSTYDSINSLDCGRELDVQLGMSSLPTSKQLSLRGRIRALYYDSVPRLLLEECRNLRVHIATSLEMREVERRGYRGLRPQWNALALAPRPQQLACIQYMQQLQAQFPHLTSLDWIVAEKSWLAGSEWNTHIRTSQNQNTSP